MESLGGPRPALSPGPWFEPLHRRNTSCVAVRQRKPEQVYLVLSLASRSDTQIVAIDAASGHLKHEGTAGKDSFASEAEALDHVAEAGPYELLERGGALLGYVPLGNLGMCLIATRMRTAAVLPGGHQIKLVAESRWLQVPLQDYAGPQMSQAEFERVENMQRFTLNNAHYLCETADITRGWPSPAGAADPSWEFVWNRWLAASLRSVGLPGHCPHLLQGVVESRVLEDGELRKYMLVLISRRSRLHPGMRYIARGLNGLASPGNEIECEQLLFSCPPSSGEQLRWSRYLWRRGTVPIWWGVELKSGGVGEATISVNAKNPYQGMRRYFRRLQRRYDGAFGSRASGPVYQSGSPGADAASAGSDVSPVPITCINLLRCNMQRRDELLLSEHFSEGVRRVRRALPGAQLRVINFDWHGMIKELRDEPTVEGLWTLLESILPQAGVSEGTLEERRASGADASVSGREVGESWGDRWRVDWRSRQHGVVRYNCADSLDRTNAASYFASVQVLAEQAKRIGVTVCTQPRARDPTARAPPAAVRRKPRDFGGALEISSIHRRVRDMMRAQAPAPGPAAASNGALPPGWEERIDSATQRKFFIDHNTKRTTWERPVQNSGSPMASAVAQLKEGASDSVESSDCSDTESQSAAPPKEPQWGLLGLDVDGVRERLRADLVAAHAEIFLINGDINSNLYTSSRAMHSAIIGLLQGEHGAVTKAGVGKLANLGVTLQRRWANVLSDAARQVVLECFLGLRLREHFPSQTAGRGGEEGVPLDEADDDLWEPEEGSPLAVSTATTDSLPPDLTNQGKLENFNASSGGDSATVNEMASALDGAPEGCEGDPGAFLSPAVTATGIRAASQEEAQHPLS